MSEAATEDAVAVEVTGEATHGHHHEGHDDDGDKRLPDADDQNDETASVVEDSVQQPVSQEVEEASKGADLVSLSLEDNAASRPHGSDQEAAPAAEHVDPSAESIIESEHEMAAADTDPSPNPANNAADDNVPTTAASSIVPLSESSHEIARSPSPFETRKDIPAQNNDQDDDDDDDDDDYDPESVFSTPAPSQPPSSSLQTQSETFLKSVLDEVKKPQSQSSSSGGQPVDLSKLLSSMGAIKPASATNTTATNTPSIQRPDIDAPFTAEETADYEQFLATEAEYVKTGRWDQFPYGSRMFVGNLPVTKITKAQLFKLFRTYGRMAQISIKQAYGFIQYFDPDNCKRAMETESKEPLLGSNLHLEISKPQIPKRERERQREQERQHRREQDKDRDRSRSPRRRNKRGGSGRNNRQRSPMRSGSNSMPMGQRRQGSFVPECPIYVLERLDPQFVQYVENELNSAGIRVAAEDVRSNAAQNMIRQAAFDGATAVISLNMKNQNRGSVDIQIFDRTGSNMRFDEYLDVQTHVAVELINRAKRQAATAPPSLPPVPRYGQHQQQQPPPHHHHHQPPVQQYQPQPLPQQYGANPAAASNLLGTLQQMDPSALQSMMHYIQAQNQQQQQQQQQALPQQSFAPPQYGQQQPYGYGGYNAPAPTNSSMPQAANPSQSTQQVQDIMEQLAQLQKRQ